MKTRGARNASTSADILVDLAQQAVLFHTADALAYADIDFDGHRETWAIRSRGFRRWLSQRFFTVTKGAPSSQALAAALNVLEAKAQFEGPERPVFVRVGGMGDRLYLDLADDAWGVVEIGPGGWRVIGD